MFRLMYIEKLLVFLCICCLAYGAPPTKRDDSDPFIVICDTGEEPPKYVFELYFLFDASGSTVNDRLIFEAVLIDVLNFLQENYPGSRVGFGSYVDKPFWRITDYCYKNHVALTTNLDDVREAVRVMPSGHGGDAKESLLDGLYYAARRSETGWTTGNITNEGNPIFKAIFVLTDAGFQTPRTILKLKKKLIPNRQQDDYDCANENYVSVPQAGEMLAEKQIHPVFLVPTKLHRLYNTILLPKFSGFGITGLAQIVSRDTTDLLRQVKGSLKNVVCEVRESKIIGKVMDTSSNNLLCGLSNERKESSTAAATDIKDGLPNEALTGSKNTDEAAKEIQSKNATSSGKEDSMEQEEKSSNQIDNLNQINTVLPYIPLSSKDESKPTLSQDTKQNRNLRQNVSEDFLTTPKSGTEKELEKNVVVEQTDQGINQNKELVPTEKNEHQQDGSTLEDVSSQQGTAEKTLLAAKNDITAKDDLGGKQSAAPKDDLAAEKNVTKQSIAEGKDDGLAEGQLVKQEEKQQATENTALLNEILPDEKKELVDTTKTEHEIPQINEKSTTELNKDTEAPFAPVKTIGLVIDNPHIVP